MQTVFILPNSRKDEVGNRNIELRSPVIEDHVTPGDAERQAVRRQRL